MFSFSSNISFSRVTSASAVATLLVCGGAATAFAAEAVPTPTSSEVVIGRAAPDPNTAGDALADPADVKAPYEQQTVATQPQAELAKTGIDPLVVVAGLGLLTVGVAMVVVARRRSA